MKASMNICTLALLFLAVQAYNPTPSSPSPPLISFRSFLHLPPPVTPSQKVVRFLHTSSSLPSISLFQLLYISPSCHVTLLLFLFFFSRLIFPSPSWNSHLLPSSSCPLLYKVYLPASLVFPSHYIPWSSFFLEHSRLFLFLTVE